MNKFKNLFFVLLLILIILPFANSAQTGNTEDCDCSSEIIKITELTQNNSNLSQQVTYYSNLSEYYEEGYLSKEVNISNRELIALNQYIYILNQNITDLSTEIGELKQEVTFFNLTIKLTLSLLSITLLGALVKWSIKKWKLKQKLHISTKIS
jgi:cell division protein FtsL